jgi:hypothetical protein
MDSTSTESTGLLLQNGTFPIQKRTPISQDVLEFVLSIKGLGVLVASTIFWNAVSRSLDLLLNVWFPNASDATQVGIWWLYIPMFFVGFVILEFIVIRIANTCKPHNNHKKTAHRTTTTTTTLQPRFI